MRKLIVAEFITPDGSRVNLKLLEATSLPTGVVYQRYQPVR